jgi:shikimate kinase
VPEGSPAGRHVVLVGMMGAGKSTVGELLASRLGVGHVDTDTEVERRCGGRLEELWRCGGEVAFRAAESLALSDALGREGPLVVSVGGGAVLDPANRELIRQRATVVWLRAEVATLQARVGAGQGRPLLSGDPAAALARLDRVRRPVYQSLADVVVDVDREPAAAVAERVARVLGREGPS